MSGKLQTVRRLKMFTLAAVGASVCLFAGAQNAAALQVYANDFDSPETFAGGVSGGLTIGTPGGTSFVPGVYGVQNYATLGGFSGNMLVSNGHDGVATSMTTLVLNNLPTHTSLGLGFLLATINSWDGNVTPFSGTFPDLFNVEVDGVSVFSETFRNVASDPQSFVPPGGSELARGGEFWTVNNPQPIIDDGAYDVGLVPTLQAIAHTGSTATIRFYASGVGWQENETLRGDPDELWGIENLTVTVATSTIPEAATLGLLAIGLAGLGWAARRRR